MKTIDEADWKIFKEIKAEALDKFCKQAISQFSITIHNENKSAHERYLDHFKELQDIDKEMGWIFDGHSRSKAADQLTAYRVRDLVDEENLSRLGEDIKAYTDPARFQ